MGDTPTGAENYRHIVEIRSALKDLYEISRAHGHKIDSHGTALNLEHDLRMRISEKLDDLIQWRATEMALRQRAAESLQRRHPAEIDWKYAITMLIAALFMIAALFLARGGW